MVEIRSKTSAPVLGDFAASTGTPIVINRTVGSESLSFLNSADTIITYLSPTGYVPYTGATANVNLGTYDITADLVTANGLKITSAPIVTGNFIGSGTAALFGHKTATTATSATSPEIGAEFRVDSSAGLANKTTAYKIALGGGVIADAGSADIYGINFVNQGYAGSGGHAIYGCEIDINNLGSDAGTFNSGTASHAFIAIGAGTANHTSAYWATAVSGTKWMYGYAVTGIEGGNITVSVADFYSDTGSPTIFKSIGSHTDGIDLTGATISGKAFKSTGFSVDPDGDTVAKSVNIDAAGFYLIDSQAVMYKSGTKYTVLQAYNGTGGIALGNATDAKNYYSNTTHTFRSLDTLTTFGTWNETALTVNTALNLNASTASRILSTDSSKNVTALDTATYPSLTELSYVKGVTSAVQTQINTKAPTASPTFTGVATSDGFASSVASSSTPHLDTSGTTLYTIAFGANTRITPANSGAYIITVFETTRTGAITQYICSGGDVAWCGYQTNGTTWEASTTTPTGGKYSIAYSGSGYNIYNNLSGGDSTFRVNLIRIG